MNNAEISNLLNTIADLLDIKGENFFKIRAYRLAAQTILDSEEEIPVLVKEQRLKALSGIGEAIAKKITEYVNTGKLEYFEELKKEIPLSVLELLQIPTLGPKKVSTLYHTLHIDTIEKLEEACEQGRLRELDGFGEITERNILRGLKLKERTSGRSLLHQAYTDGTGYLSYMHKCKKVQQANLAGSLRRMKETIGDIDILAASEDPDPVMQHFINYPSVKRVLLQGKTKTSVLLQDDIQVDLRVVSEKSYGAALQYFTGSKEHNVTLRGLALRNGFKLNEYGIFDKETDTLIAGRTEAEVYKKVGLSYIPPELRENRGEIDAAKNNTLPTLITLDEIQGDLHVHSAYSDGSNSIKEIAEATAQRKYAYVGIADHSQSLKIAQGLNIEAIKVKKKEIEQINKESKIKVFCGTECDIKTDGSLDYPDEILKLFDYVAIGIHTGFKMDREQATERILAGMNNPFVTFLAHPTCRMIGYREGFDLDMEKIFEQAVQTHTALEINSFPDRLDLNDIMVKRGKELGVQFIIGSDAHALQHLDNMIFGVATARRGWLEIDDVINTFDVQKIQTFFKEARGKHG
jgi:DNA polymerase (family X)